jgi:hypothetical protein
MERALLAAEHAEDSDRAVDVRLNLAVALNRRGNEATTMEEFSRHYGRCVSLCEQELFRMYAYIVVYREDYKDDISLHRSIPTRLLFLRTTRTPGVLACSPTYGFHYQVLKTPAILCMSPCSGLASHLDGRRKHFH